MLLLEQELPTIPGYSGFSEVGVVQTLVYCWWLCQTIMFLFDCLSLFLFLYVFFFFCISYIFWVIFLIWPLHCLPSSIYDLWLLVWYIERCFSYSYILTQLTLSLSELTILSFKLTSTLLTKFSLFYRICASFPL